MLVFRKALLRADRRRIWIRINPKKAIPFTGVSLIARISVLFPFEYKGVSSNRIFSANGILKVEETLNYPFFFLFFPLWATNAGSPVALTDGQNLPKHRLPHSQETKIVQTNAGTKLRNEKAFHGLEMPVLSLFSSQKTLKHLGLCFWF